LHHITCVAAHDSKHIVPCKVSQRRPPLTEIRGIFLIMEKEIWKDVPGYVGRYKVSNLGRVYSVERTIMRSNNNPQTIKGKILKCSVSHYGYVVVCFEGKHHKVHRLVAMAFIPNPDNKPEIDHINTNRTDNRVENLHWVSHKENFANPISRKNLSHTISQAQREQLSQTQKGLWIGKNSPRAKKILQLTKDEILVKVWESVSDAGRFLNVSHTNISKCLTGKIQTAYGFKWKYKWLNK